MSTIISRKLKATTDYGTTDESKARAVIAHMLDNNQAVTKNITPYIVLVEFDFDNETNFAVVSLSRNAGHSFDGMDVDYEIGEALAQWKAERPAGVEVFDLETFTVETEYVRPAFNPNYTKFNSTAGAVR